MNLFYLFSRVRVTLLKNYFIVLSITLSSCSYRFTNLHLRAPSDSRTIAIEGIYDTSKTVIPHEYLWKSLQQEFATNGVLQLSSQAQADLYLRTQILDVSINPQNIESSNIKEPKYFNSDRANGKNPHPPSHYPSYRRARSFAKENGISMTIRVEVWDIRTQKLIFNSSFSQVGTYGVYSVGSAVEYGFLRADENFERAVEGLSSSLAKQVVRSVLSST